MAVKQIIPVDMSLTPAQQVIDRCGAKNIVIEAGRKFGKTEYSIRDILKASEGSAYDGRGDEICYVAPFRIQAKDIFWRRLKRAIPPQAMSRRPSEAELNILLANDILISLKGADNEDSVRGLNPRRFVLEEAAFMREGFWEEVAQPNLQATQGGALFISSPKGRNWFHKLYEKAKSGELGPDWAGFHFTIYYNPYISRDAIEQIKRTVTREVWEQEYMANPDAYSGQQYHEFQKQIHVVPHREPRKQAGIFLVRSIDWGWEHPSTCLWGELFKDEKRNKWCLYIYGEFGRSGQNCGDFSNLVKGISGNNQFLWTTICSSARRTEFATGKSILSQFVYHGIPCTLPPNDDSFRVNAAKMMLRDVDVTISNRCVNLARELTDVEWGDLTGDDYADAFKYMCSFVYQRDFTSYTQNQEKKEDLPNDPSKGPIDPTGIFYQENQEDAIQWAGSGYIG